MADSPQPSPDVRVKSPHVVYLFNNGQHYIFHDLHGYLLGCSRDLIDLLEAFRSPVSVAEISARFAGRFEPGQFEEFITTFGEFSCLLPEGHDEDADVLKAFVYRSRWALSHTDRDNVTTFYAGRRDGSCREFPLDPLEQSFVDAVDGNHTTLSLIEGLREDPAFRELPEEVVRDRVLALLRRLVHHDAQVLKLSRVPFRFFRNREESLPPYLVSAAHFDEFDPDAPPSEGLDAAGLEQRVSPLAYYRSRIADAERQFDEVETTISHLFREPHPALGDETYGERFAQTLWERSFLHVGTRSILEVGGGLGLFASAFLRRFKTLANLPPATDLIPASVKYTILDASPALAEAQARNLADVGTFVRIEQIAGNAEEFCEPAEAFDLILCNEVISDFTVDTLDAEEAASAEALARIPHVGERLAEIGIHFENPPAQFQVNTGAMRFVQNAFRLLKPGGICVLTEYGEMDRYPVFSSQLDHPEYSIHFGPIIEFASSLGFEWEFESLPDFLNMDLKFHCLSTTRPFFVALRHLMSRYGIELKKIAYTHDMLRKLVGDRIELMNVQRLTFEPIDRRCMGLSPREFKVLMLGKPVPASSRFRIEMVNAPAEEED